MNGKFMRNIVKRVNFDVEIQWTYILQQQLQPLQQQQQQPSQTKRNPKPKSITS